MSCVPSLEHLLQPTDSNPSPTTVPPPIAGLSSHHVWKRHVASVIGLPLRGKAHMARRLKRYLQFFYGIEVELFDLNKYLGPTGDDDLLEALREFFEGGEGADGDQPRGEDDSGRFAILFTTDTNIARSSMWSGHSKGRRRWMSDVLRHELQTNIIFVEIQVDDSTTHRKEYMERLELARGLQPHELERTVGAYAQRFVTIQDDGTEDDLVYMKLINYNHKVVTNNMMRTFIGSRIAQFLTSVHPYPRTIYISRHGESEYNVEKKLGGDSALSPLGREYARRLAEFATFVVCGGASRFACVTLSPRDAAGLGELLADGPEGAGVLTRGDWSAANDAGAYAVREGMRLVRLQRGEGADFEDAPATAAGVLEAVGQGPATLVFVEGGQGAEQVCARLWTSSMRRTRETVAHVQHPTLELPGGRTWEQMSHRIYRNLDEVYAGEFEGLTYDEVKRRAPLEASLRKLDKLGYRYPRGESYYDVIARLDNPMQQVETLQEPVLIVGHQAVHRLVYAFLKGIPREQATELSIPLHTVIRLDFDGTNQFQEVRYFLGPTRLVADDGQRHL